MHRIFILQEDVKETDITIRPEEAQHAYSVLRLRKGDCVYAFDGRGMEYQGELIALTPKNGIIHINGISSAPKDIAKITLAAAIPKLSKFDSIVDKATQLGVNNLIPLISQRTIVKISKDKAEDKRLRWRKIAIEAAKQCGCSYVPEIAPITRFSVLVKEISEYPLAIIPCLQADTVSLKKVIKENKPKDTIIFIGPEGDFTKEEVHLAKANGAIGAALGKNVLRCETAVIMVLSVLNYEWKL